MMTDKSAWTPLYAFPFFFFSERLNPGLTYHPKTWPDRKSERSSGGGGKDVEISLSFFGFSRKKADGVRWGARWKGDGKWKQRKLTGVDLGGKEEKESEGLWGGVRLLFLASFCRLHYFAPKGGLPLWRG